MTYDEDGTPYKLGPVVPLNKALLDDWAAFNGALYGVDVVKTETLEEAVAQHNRILREGQWKLTVEVRRYAESLNAETPT